MAIENLVKRLAESPFDPVLSVKIAQEYEEIGQTASAISFYLRAAEYGYETHPEYVYASLLKSAKCFEHQAYRESTVMNLLLKALAYLPQRPEAWFLLSQKLEREKKWQECYTHAEVGLSVANKRLSPLPVDVGYPGTYGLEFEKAVSAWWVGRKDESVQVFTEILGKEISHEYHTAIINNLSLFENYDAFDPLEPVVTNYRKFFGERAPIVIDIGTRDGDDAYYLYKNLKSTTVIAVDAS